MYPDFILARRELKRHKTDPPWPSPPAQEAYRDAFLAAVDLSGRGDVTAAIETFEDLPVEATSDAAVLTNHGNALTAVGRMEDALQLHRRAVDVEPRIAVGHHNLGFVHHKLGRLTEAIAAYQLALTFEPREAATWMNLANALRDAGHTLEALDVFRYAAHLRPDQRDPLVGIAAIARMFNRWDVAIDAYRRLEQLTPDDQFVANEIGACLFGQNKIDEARPYFLKATKLDPASPWGFANLAGVALHCNDFAAIQEHLKEALKRAPDNLPMLVSLAHAGQQMCDWTDYESTCIRIEEQVKRGFAGGEPLSVLPFPLFSMPLNALTLTDHLGLARRYGEDNFGKLRALQPAQARQAPASRDRIRVGYLSCDFHGHPVAQVLAETIELHDRSRFQVYALSHGKSPEDETRTRLRKAFDHFIDIDGFNDEAAADAIRGHEIDILVDLGGYTRGARGGILALRAAPVQINYLGYPGTLGVDFVDYLIADEFVIPPHLEPGYAEKVLRMPHCYLPSDRKRPRGAPPARQSLHLPEDGIVFCAFNSPHKITPDMFAIWCRLLADVADSVLWIRSDNKTVNANLLANAARHGISSQRLVFAARAEVADHFARLRQADLMLDTFPYTSHSTASDALWCAVPIVTRTGDTFASRVAGSLLHACGLDDLVAETGEQYYKLARDLARNRPRLKQLKSYLETTRLDLPAFDSAAHTRDLEQIYFKVLRDQPV
jgi:protein O-GlcNAc transferase